jgi:aspartate/methionine/tyrosine aminotransferase
MLTAYRMTNNLLGITTVPLPCHYADGFMPSPSRAASLITPRTKALVLVSPNNPVRPLPLHSRTSSDDARQTGAVYPPALLAKFAALARDRNIALILDETYRDFILEGSPHHLFSPSSPSSATNIHAPPDWTWRSTLISLYSFSKAYHIPGHRMGLMVGAPALVTAATTVLDCLQICGGRPVQRALGTPGLLHALRPFVRGTAETLGARHAAFARAMAELAPRWRVGAQGGYYAFVRAPFARGAREVCERLAAEDGVVALPAEFFAAGAGERDAGMEDGWERWLRVSVANVEEERLVEVARRLGECAERWGWDIVPDLV